MTNFTSFSPQKVPQISTLQCKKKKKKKIVEFENYVEPDETTNKLTLFALYI